MSIALRVFLGLMVLFHLLAFIGEAILWSNPGFQAALLPRLNPDSSMDPVDEGAALTTLFINQGFYNLMIAVGAVIALRLGLRNDMAPALVLAGYLGAFVLVAGIVLGTTTSAVAGAILQGGIGLGTLLLSRR